MFNVTRHVKSAHPKKDNQNSASDSGENSEAEITVDKETETGTSSKGNLEKKINLNRKQSETASTTSDFVQSIQHAGIIRDKKVKDAIGDCFVDNFISFRVVETESFKKMMSTVNQKFPHMSRRTLTRLTSDRYKYFQNKLKR